MSSRSSSFLGAFAGAALLLLSGCGGDGDSDGGGEEETGTTCPPGGTTLTYQNFGQNFVNTYCLRCHNSALTGGARNGAPAGANFDTLEGIRAEADEMNERAGASGSMINEEMPPNGLKPTVEERRQLSEWLSCGAP